MLNYDFIFKKGILFVNLKGDITKRTSELFSNEIDPLILDNGITNVVFNVRDLKKVSKVGIMETYKNALKLSENSNISFIGVPTFLRKKFKILLQQFKERDDYI